MNNYRVDKNEYDRVPCGMNSIAYVGDSLSAARRMLASLRWSSTHASGTQTTSGVLSRWDENKRDYVILDRFRNEPEE